MYERGVAWFILARAVVTSDVDLTPLTRHIAAPHKSAVAHFGHGDLFLPILPITAELLTRREMFLHGCQLHLLASLSVQDSLGKALAVEGKIARMCAVVGRCLQVHEMVTGWSDIFIQTLDIMDKHGWFPGPGCDQHLESIVVFLFEEVSYLIVAWQFSPTCSHST